MIEHSDGKSQPIHEIIMKPTALKTGHLCVRLQMNGKTEFHYIHRLVLQTFVGPCPDEMECCHWDGNPTNNHVSNLRWDTHKNNGADSIRCGALPRGENHHNSKLTEIDVQFVRHWLRRGYTQTLIAEKFGVSRRSIGDIKNKILWTWLEETV